MSRFFSPKYLKYRRAIEGGEIDVNLPCTHCGYNVRGLRFGGVCPECGTPIVLAEGMYDSLSEAPLPEILRLRAGFTLATLSAIPLMLAPIGAALAVQQSLAGAMLLFCVSVVWTMGVWLMTPALDAPDAVRRGFGMRAPLRRTIRILQLGWPVACILAMAALPAIGLKGVSVDLAKLGAAIGALAGLVAIILLSILLSRLSEWCYNDFAQRQFNWAVWGLTICSAGLLLALVSMVFKLLACIFGVFWIGGVCCFFIGLFSLGRSVSWSVLHARQRAARDRELHEDLEERPASMSRPKPGEGEPVPLAEAKRRQPPGSSA